MTKFEEFVGASLLFSADVAAEFEKLSSELTNEQLTSVQYLVDKCYKEGFLDGMEFINVLKK